MINTGSVDLTDIAVNIPLSTEFTGWTSTDLTLSGGSFILTGETLAIGTQKVYTFQATANDQVQDMTTVTTQATVSDTPEGAVG